MFGHVTSAGKRPGRTIARLGLHHAAPAAGVMSSLTLFENPTHLLEKLERNRWRVWEALKHEQEVDVGDGFFDFCVTAHALRDWVRKDPAWREPIGGLDALCNRTKELTVCRDIANANKHFGLNEKGEKARKTLAVFPSQSGMVDLYVHEETQEIYTELRDSYDIAILHESGEMWGLYEFMRIVVEEWRTIIYEQLGNYS